MRLLLLICFACWTSDVSAQQIRFGGQIVVVSPVANPVNYTPTATKFNADYLVHTSDLTGISDGGIFTASLWFKLSDAAQDGTFRRLAEFAGIGLGAAGSLRITVDTVNILRVQGQNAGGTTVLTLKSTSTYTASTNWHHVATSVDMSDAAKQFLYIDDVNELNSTIFTVGETIDFANGGNFGVMARGTDGDGIVTGSQSELFFHTLFLDLSVVSNRRLFRSVTGHPVSLGANGSVPFGVQPRVYLANGFATYQNNLGSGGNFSVTGSLQDDPAIP